MNQTHMITEQGDLGLGANEIKKEDKKKTEEKKSSKKGYIPGALGGKLGRRDWFPFYPIHVVKLKYNIIIYYIDEEKFKGGF